MSDVVVWLENWEHLTSKGDKFHRFSLQDPFQEKTRLLCYGRSLCDTLSVLLQILIQRLTTWARFVLGGYSQGAVVVHRAAVQLSPEILSKVIATATFGDGGQQTSGAEPVNKMNDCLSWLVLKLPKPLTTALSDLSHDGQLKYLEKNTTNVSLVTW
jgi:hypothetical protein